MTDLSLYFANKLLRWMAGNAMPSAPASVFLALYDGDPKSGGSEVTTTIAAARLAISFAALASGTGNVLTSNADVDFGPSLGSVPNLDHVAVFDASTSGNLLWARALPGAPYNVTPGTDVKFLSGDITFTAGS
jgi:hypothetical protein